MIFNKKFFFLYMFVFSVFPKLVCNDSFWKRQSNTLSWFQKPTVALQYTWNKADAKIQHSWFEDGILNVSFNCLDRHLQTQPNKIAMIWQGNEEKDVQRISYKELHAKVCQFANGLKKSGISKGDRVCIYMPMIPEVVIAMLACSRIGAIHSVVFSGFQSEALGARIRDCECKCLIVSNVAVRGEKVIPLKEIADEALEEASSIEKVIVVKRNEDPCPMQQGRDVWYEDFIKEASDQCDPEPMKAEDPLFLLYTSGSTGKPKALVHTQAGYLLYTSLTHKQIFHLQEEDIYWCTADVGWITGHSYVVYGPLANGSTIVLFEGTPTYPNEERYWKIIDTYKVNIFYTSPTVIRSLMRFGVKNLEKYHLSSLKVIGTVGELLNKEAWSWIDEHIGRKKVPILDTWWQTETGGILLSPSHNQKPESAGKPFWGIEPVILRDNGSECNVNERGHVCIKQPWPGIARTIWKNATGYQDTYFFGSSQTVYISGDQGYVDQDGDFWILGRVDDVMNVSGHRISAFEVESALASFKGVVEAAVIGKPHAIKGESLCAFVILEKGMTSCDIVKGQILQHVRKKIGSFAVPDELQFVSALPKTRSGKILRRVLRKIVMKQWDEIGDLSTLSEELSFEELLKNLSISADSK